MEGKRQLGLPDLAVHHRDGAGGLRRDWTSRSLQARPRALALASDCDIVAAGERATGQTWATLGRKLEESAGVGRI